MTEMVRGFRGKITADIITVDMGISGGAVYDFSCFGVDEGGKLSDDRYMIFYNQPESPNHEITYTPSEGGASFAVSLSELPQKVAKLVFTASIDGEGTMSQIASHTLRISAGSEELAMTLSGEDFHDERAIISVEIYRKDGWKIAAVASGFNGGLRELLKNYGGEEMNPSEPVRKPVILEKGQKVSLEKKPNKSGEIIINLNWNRGSERKRLITVFSKQDGAIDLDLGCLYELQDGRKGSVQALGGNFGNLEAFPYIALDADDRTGDTEGGENLRVNSAAISKFKRILVYTFIYEGIANWQDADGVATVKCPGNPDIVVKLDEYNTSERMCAVAMMENAGNNTFSVEKLVSFFPTHSEMDIAYSWGLRWVKGRKD
ncbi:MAG: TerD family protein [Synergistaceae bacterium]|nr:TerD family protein [Synergistaceae bacterium]